VRKVIKAAVESASKKIQIPSVRGVNIRGKVKAKDIAADKITE
jgi:hypothetical protein